MPITHEESVAVVGIALRLPGGNSTPDEFAAFLRAGRSGLRPLPTDRWDTEGLFSDDPEAKGTIRCARGGFLDDIDTFDAKFFNISPKEADYVDPQQRLALEVAWEALEDAGMDPTPLRHGNGGVYMAVSNMDYAGEMGAYAAEELNSYMPTGAALSAVSGRVAYFLGWRGPCLTVDTACSASLAAVHLAAQALRGGETDLALCGGVNTIHSPRPYILASQGNMLAPDGVCKTFDEAADGYCRSEGAAALVLKRLGDARRDGDRVYALVRSSAIGQDGESGSLMVPNGAAQERLIRTALASGDLHPGDISCVEAHGTGTPLGDPIEIGAISAVFGASHTAEQPLTVGSLKTNIGHMESAAGIGGLIKAVLQIRDAAFYPHLNLRTPSSRIPWDDIPVTVPTEYRPWSAPVRRALVNSFGLTGTIASVVVEQPPADREAAGAARPAAGPHVLALSAKTPGALRGQVRRYQELLSDEPDTDLGDLCYTAGTGRAHFGLRIAGAVRSHEDVTRLLDRALTRSTQPARPAAGGRTAFLFSGGGTQYVGMGRPLYEQFEAFREPMDECDGLFEPHLGRSVRDMVLGVAEDAELIHQIRYMQPALFTLEYAMARLWLAWGVRPTVLAGHSIGEIVAATVAGVFSLRDAVTLMAARASLMDASPAGAMTVVEATAAEAAAWVADYPDLSLAAVNGTRNTVLSGGRESLARLEETLAVREVKTTRLAVSCASHSPLMAEAGEALTEVASGLTFHEPQFTLVSNLTGKVADPAELRTPGYWGRHLRGAVQFAQGMRAVAERGRHTFVEVGPGTELVGMGKQCLDVPGDHLWLNSLHPEDTDGTTARQTLAQLYTAGEPVSWAAHHRGQERRRIVLPTYAFDRKRHWLPAPAAGGAATGPQSGHHPLLGREVTSDGERAAGIRTFAARIGADRPAYLADHKVMGRVVFPGAGYIEMLLALQDAVYGETDRALTGMAIREALFLPDGTDTELRTRLRPGGDGTDTVEIVSVVESDEPGVALFERQHVTCALAPAGDADVTETEAALRGLAGEAGEPRVQVNADDLYAGFAELGVEYGPRFQGVVQVEGHAGQLALGELRGPDAALGELVPPALLDCAFQSLAALADEADGVAMPTGIGRLRLLKKPRGGVLRSVLRFRQPGGEPDAASGPPVADLVLLDGDRTVLVLEELTLQPVANAAPDRERMYSEVRWIKRSLRSAEPPEPGPRHALLVGAPRAAVEALAEPAKDREVTLSVAATGAEAGELLRERPADVCWFWQPAAHPEESLREECERNYRGLLALRDVLEESGFGHDQRLWLVTEGGQWVPGDRPGDGVAEGPPAAASLWGFGHVMWTEYPAYRVTLVDLPSDAGGGYASLLDEWTAPDATDFQVAYRAGQRHVRRVYDERGGPDPEVELVLREPGRISGIAAVPLGEPAEPTGSQIQVRVSAAGINLKDLFNVLGLHRQFVQEAGTGREELPLGQECAGVVTAAGPDASFRAGDEVVVAQLGCLKRQVTVESAAAVRKPPELGFAEAAALPTAFRTAYLALHELAGIKPGDRVLVHAAAGGVGQAAVQLAQRAGAEVFATASPHKWPLLRSQGVRRLMHSRTLDFADEVLEATGGAGVDIVLNSLDLDFAKAGLKTVADGGTFVELGKTGLLTPDEARAIRPEARYVDFSDLVDEQTRHTLPQDALQDALRTVVDLVSAGELAPLPTTVYTLDEVDEAFEVLSRGANTGRVVLGLEPPVPPPAAPVELSPAETYLVTGGFGSLGQLTAEHLVKLGARHITLLGRRLPDAGRLDALRERLGRETEVVALAADIADADDVRRISGQLRAGEQPLGGVVHAAGVLADAPVTAQSWESIDTVFGAKVYGSWLLHQELAHHPGLRFFIGYSSVTSVLGSRGQANYAAANAFLDALMCARRAAGLPGTSVNWGAWGEIGLAAGMDAQHIASVEDQGFGFFKPAAGIRALTRLLDGLPAQITIADVDWDRCAATRPQPNPLYHKVGSGPASAAVDVDLEALLELPGAERQDAVAHVLRSLIAQQLHYEDAEDVPPDARFFEVGLDSLAAVELKNALELCFRVPLSSSDIFSYPSVGQLAEFLDSRIAGGARGEQP
ncbi:type I polyketide synthase [Streptomyces boncukensis]|uniref:Type I polyketide synthase n=1 Tax=Streptomyces boncukensis TaxID=2711219 RepID=A0A6G4WPV8_9ACTN|nr:type I polyketide synthase [Streptomyces boncukensis]NGO66862.1 type I polyketide synthase [Streptomyces boncukensis]